MNSEFYISAGDVKAKCSMLVTDRGVIVLRCYERVVFQTNADGEKKSGESKNPWLKNISEYLVDESSAEEEELVGEKEEKEEGEEPTAYVKITRDPKLIKVIALPKDWLKK